MLSACVRVGMCVWVYVDECMGMSADEFTDVCVKVWVCRYEYTCQCACVNACV